jgi:hypothetical protein
MKRSAGGWLMILGGLAIGLALWTTPTASAASHDDEARASQDFDGLVKDVTKRYQVHSKTVPMMGLVSLCARAATHGGVRGMKVVEFEDAAKIHDAGDGTEFAALVKARLGARWSAMVREHEAKEDSFIYMQSDGDGVRTRLIVVDLDGQELDMVSLSLNPEQLAKWIKEQDAKDEKKRGVFGVQGSE